MATVRANEPWQQALIWIAPNLAFFAASWEEYHTEKFVLPVINGPNEGITAVAVAHLLTAAIGPSIWTTPVEVAGTSLSFIDLNIVLFTMMGAITLLASVWTVIQEVDARMHGKIAAAARRTGRL